jgi:putative oxidoreductase
MTALIQKLIALCKAIPHDVIALLARFSIASVFWLSGQTKVQNFTLNLISGDIALGWPRLADSVVDLFRDEYRLPFIDPTFAALMAASAEHLFPALLIVGLATRFAALALLGMTATIQFFVYPDAWSVHSVWATVLLFLIAHGPGRVSLDCLLSERFTTTHKEQSTQ